MELCNLVEVNHRCPLMGNNRTILSNIERQHFLLYYLLSNIWHKSKLIRKVQSKHIVYIYNVDMIAIRHCIGPCLAKNE